MSYTVWVADSGSTKTAWWLILNDGEPILLGNTDGINPNYQSVDDIQLAQKDFLQKIRGSHSMPNVLYFYGAGCSSPSRRKTIEEALTVWMPHTELQLLDDMTGAVFATSDNSPCITAILGTGSNAAIYDGREVLSGLPSLGFMMGDLGSGFHIGKSLLRGYFSKLWPETVQQQIRLILPEDHPSFLDILYKQAKPNAYIASFAPIVHAHLQEEWAYTLVLNCFDEFISYEILPLRGHRVLPLHFVGSIAAHFERPLREACAKYGIEVGKILAAPGRDLAVYHQRFSSF